MRIHYPSMRAILSVSALLVSLPSLGVAQPPPREPEPKAQAQEQELQIPELAAREVNPDVLHIVIPKPCTGTHPDIQTHGNPAGHPALSPALTSFLSSHHLTPKGYDDPTINKVFADSFRLRSCRVCYATLEVRFKHGPGPWSQGASNYSNDTITVGVAPFTVHFAYGQIWTATVPNPKTVTYSLQTTAALNNYIFNINPPPPFVDIVVQDDTEVDYCKLSVWYY